MNGNGHIVQFPDNQQIPPAQADPTILDTLVSQLPQVRSAEEEHSKSGQRWEVQVLNPRHREIMRRLLLGATYKEVAEQIGLHVQTIMLVATSKLFVAEMSKIAEGMDLSVQQKAEELSNEALDILAVLMRRSRSEMVRKSSADSILDRAGYGKIEKRLVGVVDAEAVIREINRARRERVLGELGDRAGASEAPALVPSE